MPVEQPVLDHQLLAAAALLGRRPEEHDLARRSSSAIAASASAAPTPGRGHRVVAAAVAEPGQRVVLGEDRRSGARRDPGRPSIGRGPRSRAGRPGARPRSRGAASASATSAAAWRSSKAGSGLAWIRCDSARISSRAPRRRRRSGASHRRRARPGRTRRELTQSGTTSGLQRSDRQRGFGDEDDHEDEQRRSASWKRPGREGRRTRRRRGDPAAAPDRPRPSRRDRRSAGAARTTTSQNSGTWSRPSASPSSTGAERTRLRVDRRIAGRDDRARRGSRRCRRPPGTAEVGEPVARFHHESASLAGSGDCPRAQSPATSCTGASAHVEISSVRARPSEVALARRQRRSCGRARGSGPPAGSLRARRCRPPSRPDVEDRRRGRVAELRRRAAAKIAGCGLIVPTRWLTDDRAEVRRPAGSLGVPVDRRRQRPVREDREVGSDPASAASIRATPAGGGIALDERVAVDVDAQAISSGVNARRRRPGPSARRLAGAAIPRRRASTRTSRSRDVDLAELRHLFARTGVRAPPPRPSRNASSRTARSRSTTPRPVSSTTPRRPARSTGTSVFPKSNVIARIDARPSPSPRHAGGADVAERAVAHESASGSGRVVAGPDARPRLPRSAGAPRSRRFGVDLGTADEARLQEVELDGVRQAAGLRLVAHRVDRELQRVARSLARLGRVADVARLVVRDRHPFPARQRPSVGDDACRRAAPRRSPRCLGGGLRRRLDVDPVPAAPDPIAVEGEANSRST